MKTTLLAAAAVIALMTPAFAADKAGTAAPAPVAPVTYTFDPAHTSATWEVDHLGFSKVSGKFPNINGSVTLDTQTPANSTVTAEIDTGSIVTGTAGFDEHLKGNDFFKVQRFPKATYKSTKVEKTGENTAKVEGLLTIMGIEKPLTLDVTLNKTGQNPFSKKEQVGFSATGVINRADYGLVYARPAVPDQVTLNIQAEAAVADAAATPAAQ